MTDRYKLNLLFQKGGTRTDYYPTSEISEEALTTNSLRICMFAKDMPGKTFKYRKELENKWIRILPKLENITSISLRLRVDQEFFEAICKMKNLETVEFWSSKITDISAIANLHKLKNLYIDSFSQLSDISSLQNIKKLEVLSVCNSFKIENYDIIGNIHGLIALGLIGDQTAPKNLRIKSLKPFDKLKKLRHLDLSSTSVIDNSYDTILKLKNLERFDTTINISKSTRDKIKTHPKIKAGFFVDWDWENKKFHNGKNWST